MAVRTVDLGSVIGPQGPAGKAGPQGPRGRGSARIVVGTAKAGWTADDCDYLCDGTADEVEINAAINALPGGGGEVVILDGTYTVSGDIAIRKENVTLSGCGFGTRLSSDLDCIPLNIFASNCTVQNLYADAYGAIPILRVAEAAQHCVIQNNYLDGKLCDESLIDIYGSNNILSSNIINDPSNLGISVMGTGNINANNVRS